MPSEHRSAPSAEVEGFLDPCAVDLCITPCLDAGNVFVAPDGCHYVGETVTFLYRDVGK